MFNLNKFISSSVTFRPDSMFAPDIDANKEKLTEEIQGKKVCVIGGAGSIGSNFIKAVLRFEPKSVVVADPTRTAWPSWFGMNQADAPSLALSLDSAQRWEYADED